MAGFGLVSVVGFAFDGAKGGFDFMGGGGTDFIAVAGFLLTAGGGFALLAFRSFFQAGIDESGLFPGGGGGPFEVGSVGGANAGFFDVPGGKGGVPFGATFKVGLFPNPGGFGGAPN